MSVAEAAAVLGVHRDAAYAAVHRGEIPHIRIGRLIRVPTAALAALLGLPVPAAADPAPSPVSEEKPVELTPELRDGLDDHLRGDTSPRSAAAASSVAESTVHHCLAEGQADAAPPDYRRIYDAVAAAKAVPETEADLIWAVVEDALGGALIKETVRPDGTVEREFSAPNERLLNSLPGPWRQLVETVREELAAPPAR
ncbi:helix-turn-helix domain-containing protein [Planomonospora sp. ID82291]|nr:helix-turn-helix domain-containing protein [Planomonospora sp. ID82291]